MNITGVKILDLDFLNETKFSYPNSPVTILDANGASRLSKNVTARKLNTDEINQLTSILMAWSVVRSNRTNESFKNSNKSRSNSSLHLNNDSRLNQRSSINNSDDRSKLSPTNHRPRSTIQDISVHLIYFP